MLSIKLVMISAEPAQLRASCAWMIIRVCTIIHGLDHLVHRSCTTYAEVIDFLHNFLHGLHNLVDRADDCLFSHASPILLLIHFGLLGLVQPSQNF